MLLTGVDGWWQFDRLMTGWQVSMVDGRLTGVRIWNKSVLFRHGSSTKHHQPFKCVQQQPPSLTPLYFFSSSSPFSHHPHKMFFSVVYLSIWLSVYFRFRKFPLHTPTQRISPYRLETVAGFSQRKVFSSWQSLRQIWRLIRMHCRSCADNSVSWTRTESGRQGGSKTEIW